MEYVIDQCCKTFSILSLKPFQQKCLSQLLISQNVFVSCQTGSGKSMCYELFPTAVSYFPRVSLGTVVIIVEPLLSIDEESVNRLKRLGQSATYIGRDTSECESITNGEMTFLFTSAESILSTEPYRSMLSTEAYQNRDVLLVIDEAHTIISW